MCLQALKPICIVSHICLTKHEIDWCFSIDHRVHSEMMLTASSFPLLTEHVAMNVYFSHFDCLSTQLINELLILLTSR